MLVVCTDAKAFAHSVNRFGRLDSFQFLESEKCDVQNPFRWTARMRYSYGLLRPPTAMLGGQSRDSVQDVHNFRGKLGPSR